MSERSFYFWSDGCQGAKLAFSACRSDRCDAVQIQYSVPSATPLHTRRRHAPGTAVLKKQKRRWLIVLKRVRRDAAGKEGRESLAPRCSSPPRRPAALSCSHPGHAGLGRENPGSPPSRGSRIPCRFENTWPARGEEKLSRNEPIDRVHRRPREGGAQSHTGCPPSWARRLGDSPSTPAPQRGAEKLSSLGSAACQPSA